MQSESWSRLIEVFNRIVDAPAERRSELVAEVGVADAALADELHLLLAAHDQTGGVLDRPPYDADADEFRRRWIGRELGPYRLDEIIGEGGMGVVFAASQEEPIRRRVALKLIRSGMNTAEVMRRFRTEQDALGRMQHPNIARVLDAGVVADVGPYFVMDLVTGTAIDAYCENEELPVDARIELVQAVCHALQHAHQKGIVHRDIKPSNILVVEGEQGPVPKVIDFGVAKALDVSDNGDAATDIGRVVGTPEYMSPEQRSADRDVDTRSDVYALGTVLFELLTGRLPAALLDQAADDPEWVREPPLASDSVAAYETPELACVAARRATTPRGLRLQLRGDVDWIVRKALAFDPDERYATVSEVADDLQAHLDHRPVSAGPPSVLYRARKFVRRNAAAVTVLSLAVAALVGFTAATYVQSRSVQAAYEAAREAQEETSRELERTRRVTGLLADLFEGADPAAGTGEVGSTVEMLDHGLERMRVQLAGEPVLRADLLDRVASVFRSLGRYPRSEELYRESLAIRVATDGADNVAITPTLLGLATVLRIAGKHEPALEVAQRAVRLRDAAGATPLERAEALNGLGGAHIYASAYQEALAPLRQALEIRAAELPTADGLVGEARNDLGVALARLGQTDEAEPLLREAVRIARADLPAARVPLSTRLMNLGTALRRKGDFEAAIEAVQECVEIRRDVYGPGHPETVIAVESLAVALNTGGRSTEVEALYRQVIAQRTDSGAPPVQLARTYSNLGASLRAQSRYGEAITSYEEALRLRRENGATADAQAAILRHNLAVALSQVERYVDAERHSRVAVDLFRKNYGERNAFVAVGLMRLARLNCYLGDTEAASEQFEEAADIQTEVLEPGHWRIGVRRVSYGQCLFENGDHAEAEVELLAGLRIAEAARGADSQDAQRARRWLVALYEATGRADEAARYSKPVAGASG